MRRLVIPLLLVALAVTAFLYRDRWLPQPPGQSGYLGYVEGETMLIGAPQAGRITAVEAIKGHAVNTGEVLFALDPALRDRHAVEDWTKASIPPDFSRNPKIHKCYFVRHCDRPGL